jgi:hypothetical protein
VLSDGTTYCSAYHFTISIPDLSALGDTHFPAHRLSFIHSFDYAFDWTYVKPFGYPFKAAYLPASFIANCSTVSRPD